MPTRADRSDCQDINFGVLVLAFVWFVVKYFILPNENRSEAGMYVMYSVIGFFVVLSVWGLVNIVSNTFGLEGTAPSWSTIQSLFPGGSGGSQLHRQKFVGHRHA